MTDDVTKLPPSLTKGVEVILQAAKGAGLHPGVYRMLSEDGDILYIGKAKHLQHRILSYTRPQGLPHRLRRMVSQTRQMEIVTTKSEVEALLLEANLIRQFKPPYNIRLMDDKSFPYIQILKNHSFPQITKYRGQKGPQGLYYGPFASSAAVNQALIEFQKIFLLRSCTDSVFANRTSPCLLYHIKRCSAPCVGRISQKDYGDLLNQTQQFLEGKNKQVQKRLTSLMTQASQDEKYELAALYRDRLLSLSHILAHQDVNLSEALDADVFALFHRGNQSCIQVFFYRSGRNFGTNSYFPLHDDTATSEDIMAAFLTQFYVNKPCPPQILLSHQPQDHALLESAFNNQLSYKVSLKKPTRGKHLNLIKNALKNAEYALSRKEAERASKEKILQELSLLFEIEGTIKRIEIYDNSHIQGKQALGAMVVAGPEGFQKNQYRRYTIKTLEKGDDYGMLREVFTRRFQGALKKESRDLYAALPDLILIDGGAGQLSTAQQVMADLGLSTIPLVAIAKGPDRNAGRERFFLPNKQPLSLPPTDPRLYYLQQLRDEAHRFAIEGHRQARLKAAHGSAFDDIPGVGPKRKKALMVRFGSIRQLSAASIEDIKSVPGMNEALAEKIYNYFH